MSRYGALGRWLAGFVLAWGIGFGALRMTIAAPETCAPFDESIAETSASRATGWFAAALLPDGRYIYEYDKDADYQPDDYNLVRHAGVTMSLYQAALAGDAGALESADTGLGYMLDNLRPAGDGLAFTDKNESAGKLGAAALMLASLDLRRQATGDPAYDEEMRGLGRMIVSLQRDDGSMLNYWDFAAGAPLPGFTSKYATGEAFWALAMLHEHFPDEGWDVPAKRISLYLATRRDEAEGFMFPPWADQWAAYGLAETVEWGLSDVEIDYARRLAERFGFLVRVESRRDGDDPLEFVNGQQTRGAGMGTWVEGLTSLWHVASEDPRMADLRDDIAERAVCGAGILAERQFDADEAAGYARPELVEGGWFRDGLTRMDDQQHALSGIIRAAPIATWLEDKE